MQETEVVCRSCGHAFRATPKRTFLGFQRYGCPHCTKDVLYPLTTGYRTTYWVLVVLMVLSFLGSLSEGDVTVPGLLGIAVVIGLVRDRRIQKDVLLYPTQHANPTASSQSEVRAKRVKIGVGVGAVLAVLAVGSGKVLGKVAGFAIGAVAGREIADYFKSTPEGRESLAGMRSVVADPEVLLAPFKDSSAAWFQALGARSVARQLDVSEQLEVLQFRLQLSRLLPTEACANTFWDGKPAGTDGARAAFALMPEEARRRISFLAGRAMAKQLSAPLTVAKPFNEDEMVQFYQRYASPVEIDHVVAANEPSATPSQKCLAAQDIFAIALRTPGGTSDQMRSVRTVLGDDGQRY